MSDNPMHAFWYVTTIDTYSYRRIQPIERNLNSPLFQVIGHYCSWGNLNKLKTLDLEKIEPTKLFRYIQYMKGKIYELNRLDRELYVSRIYNINSCIEYMYSVLYKNLFKDDSGYDSETI
jgi:hypothetical protein